MKTERKIEESEGRKAAVKGGNASITIRLLLTNEKDKLKVKMKKK